MFKLVTLDVTGSDLIFCLKNCKVLTSKEIPVFYFNLNCWLKYCKDRTLKKFIQFLILEDPFWGEADSRFLPVYCMCWNTKSIWAN